MEKGSKIVHLTGLNGLRAISALAVVVSHITAGLGLFGLNAKIFGVDIFGNPKGLDLGGYGVTIFFTLSGFLITYLLLKEKETGGISIKNFYIRRVLRIWPLYYAVLLICMLLYWIYKIEIDKTQLPFYIFLAANIPFMLNRPIQWVMHYWSLGVEEQFYLFFPHVAKISNKKFFKAILFLMILWFGLKFLGWVLVKKYSYGLVYTIFDVTRFHVMLMGALAAFLYYENNKLFIAVTTSKLSQIIAWGVIVLLAINKYHVLSIIDSEIVGLVAVLLIMGQVTKRNNILNLENKVCDFIGKISYGIYVIHPLVILSCSKIIGSFKSQQLINYLAIYFLVIGTTILIAYLSYNYFEKFFLKIKVRFAFVKSSGEIVDQESGKQQSV